MKKDVEEVAREILAGERDHLSVSFHDLRTFWRPRYRGLLMELARVHPTAKDAAQLAVLLKSGEVFVLGVDVRRGVAALEAR